MKTYKNVGKTTIQPDEMVVFKNDGVIAKREIEKKFIIHFDTLVGDIDKSACGKIVNSITCYPDLVTCENCKRTKAFKRAR